MSNLITNYNVNVNGVNKDLGTIIQNTTSQTLNISTSGVTNSTTSLSFDPNYEQVIYDNCIYPSMSGSSVNGNTSISFGAKKRYGDNGNARASVCQARDWHAQGGIEYRKGNARQKAQRRI